MFLRCALKIFFIQGDPHEQRWPASPQSHCPQTFSPSCLIINISYFLKPIFLLSLPSYVLFSCPHFLLPTTSYCCISLTTSSSLNTLINNLHTIFHCQLIQYLIHSQNIRHQFFSSSAG